LAGKQEKGQTQVSAPFPLRLPALHFDDDASRSFGRSHRSPFLLS
jgi:hypothetical protein